MQHHNEELQKSRSTLGNEQKRLTELNREQGASSGVTESKKEGCLEAKKGHYEFTQVLAITKPFISSGCFKKIIL